MSLLLAGVFLSLRVQAQSAEGPSWPQQIYLEPALTSLWYTGVFPRPLRLLPSAELGVSLKVAPVRNWLLCFEGAQDIIPHDSGLEVGRARWRREGWYRNLWFGFHVQRIWQMDGAWQPTVRAGVGASSLLERWGGERHLYLMEDMCRQGNNQGTLSLGAYRPLTDNSDLGVMLFTRVYRRQPRDRNCHFGSRYIVGVSVTLQFNVLAVEAFNPYGVKALLGNQEGRPDGHRGIRERKRHLNPN